MKVSGFTFIRNAVKYDYPIVESIRSILSIIDEFVVLVGKSDDNTLALIESIDSPKIKIFSSVWDDTLRQGGRVLAVETNKAFQLIATDSDWAFYLQADEVIHEKYLPIIKKAMQDNLSDKEVEGLLFKYKHFYGSYDYIGNSRRWYRQEIRLIRNDKQIQSYRDAQGFRKNGQKLKVRAVDASVYHYGWVKHPEVQQAKSNYFPSLWSDTKPKEAFTEENFDYSQIDSLAVFEGKHPKVMQERIVAKKWDFNFDPTKKRFDFKTKVLNVFEKLTNYRLGEYKNYILLKRD
ncbi:MAG: glycosyltransferase family 2 protein [Bacteroidetes bacterium]|nr:MAG: glycosyltransferase family 2 protein [Bacteroidota bacterium]